MVIVPGTEAHIKLQKLLYCKWSIIPGTRVHSSKLIYHFQCGWAVLGRWLKSPLGWILKTLQGGRVVLGQLGACLECWSILLAFADKTRVLERPSSWRWKIEHFSRVLGVGASLSIGAKALMYS